jgi:hypothetical protein
VHEVGEGRDEYQVARRNARAEGERKKRGRRMMQNPRGPRVMSENEKSLVKIWTWEIE